MAKLSLSFLILFIVLHCTNAGYGDELFARHVERALLDARNKVLTHLRESGVPFVRVHDCIDDPVSEANLEKTVEQGTTLDKIFKTKELRFGFLVSQTYGEAFQFAIDEITSYFSKNFGKKVHALKIEFGTNSELIEALLNRDIDLTFPGFYVGGFYPTVERLTDVRPLCSLTAMDFYFYVRANPSDAFPEPFDNVKSLMNSTLSLDKTILCFSKELTKILNQAYPEVKTVYKDSGSNIGKLLKSDKYSAVFGSLIYKKEIVEQSGLKLISGDFALPALVYTRSEDKKLSLDSKDSLKRYHTGNTPLRVILDSIIYARQAVNYKAELEVNENMDIVTVGDCVTDPPIPPDEIEYGGTLQQIVGKKEILVGYAKVESSLLIVSDDPKGPVYDLDKDIVEELGKFLDVTLKFIPVVYDTAEELFRGLEMGRIDMTTSSMITGSTFDSVPRRWLFQYTCSTFGWELKILILTRHNLGDTFSAVKHKICSLNGKAKFIVLNPAVGEVLNDALNCNIVIEVFTSMSNAVDIALSEPNYYGIVPEFIDEVPSDFESDLKAIETGEYIPTTIFLRKDAYLDFEDDDSILLIVSLILFGCVAVVIFSILIVYYVRVYRNNQVTLTADFEGRQSKKGAYIQIEDVQSIGDEDDPDYVAPKF